MTEPLELDGKTYIPAETAPLPQWPCVINNSRLSTLTLKDDDIFLVTDTLGNIPGCLPGEVTTSVGLFCQDTRFLSRLELQIDGQLPILLSSNASRGFAMSILCANPHLENRQIGAETIGIEREIVINGGLFEQLAITNYSTSPISFELSLSFDADFVDLFEIRGWERKQHGKLLRLVSETENSTVEIETVEAEATSLENLESAPSEANLDQAISPFIYESRSEFSSSNLARSPSRTTPIEDLILAYQGLDGAVSSSRIQFSARQPDYLKGYTAIWRIELHPHQTTHLGYRVQLLTNNRSISKVGTPMTLMQAKAAESMELQEWQQQVTIIRSDSNTFNRLIERGEQDIYLLRQSFEERKFLSAGIPWFSTLFGRDSIIAAWQTLILDPKIAKDTLFILAQYQGTIEDQWREESPGKILHELRLGEMARCGEIPHTPYYGTVDATPLWLILYAEYYAWSGDRDTIEQLWENALAAMSWIDRNSNSTGYLAYTRYSPSGLLNQGWKDSGDCIVNRQGQLATGPITLCEVQGYVYGAKMRLCAIAELMKRTDLAGRWYREALELKNRFNKDFWLPDLDYCALALDGEGKPVDSITSNPGHCLAMGILKPDKAMNVAERLRAPDLFSGWGIRTLSSLSPAYNPMGYHVGSVWPHDNSITALGLRATAREIVGDSSSLVDQTLEVATGIIDMTLQQPYLRPPELFCGYERREENTPVRYPVACSPQAWATGTLFQLLQVAINLVPDAANNRVRVIEPVLPESVNRLSLHNLKVGSTILDLEFERSGNTTACRVAKKRGNLRVVFEA
ncbi:amylo-alpha-1,6-glucosidase [Pleurocapsa sp. CCALA 161]|uniref:amylo-alpha-1,6-glucosidase n=1 Tax=Pleurocapsa sp. CCALA 161 TaxID=2107688 RepID=UPI000D07E600|nr:amylo-alpha-1,6-glucosidase [Pleurocapsa sp. CCALA 161]PSB12547.1 amylo-alpha-1,6-glucosidase [Pleurocapsa sp. CCALA 161]